MTLLLAAELWEERRGAMRGSLAALAEGIAADLEPVLARPVYIPAAPALLSREGGRCARDGSLLEFDPFDEQHHRCPQCGTVHEGEPHRGFWRYWYHLWLAERAVHAAVLFRLRGDPRHATFASAVLDGYADRYHGYPNADNVLGPGRVFFSTYLESIWLLQLCIALDALEGASRPAPATPGARVRERIIEPASALIAQYDEGMSNRQAWNVAASMAAARMLGHDGRVQKLVAAPHGLAWLIERGCLRDGTWYEGENYHMFAHRGLWYGIAIAEAAGAHVPSDLVARFDDGFAAPFLTGLPDMTLPSRRDSQYAISLRQPRFAELCELGLARRDDPRLRATLATLYEAPPGLPRGGNGRARTSADVERNLPAMPLGRSDLGWRALLFARPELPPLAGAPPGSVLLAGQGIAVLRRAGGRIYAALDYGHSGGGHGHPDRLNVLLMDGTTRWLDDMGTGSYVDPSLHWYRSTLAHNAPSVDGHSQRQVDGSLLAFEERGAAGWVHAAVDGAAPGVRLERILVAMPDYLVDELRWTADRAVTIDLPVHAPLRASGAEEWTPASLRGGGGLEDGHDFVVEAARRDAGAGEVVSLVSDAGMAGMIAFTAADGPWTLWRAAAPGAPGTGAHRFHIVQARGRTGRIRTVWCWGDVTDVRFEGDRTLVTRSGGNQESHAQASTGWHIELTSGTAMSSIDLGGVVAALVEGDTAPPPAAPPREPLCVPFSVTLHEPDHRRSELTWDEAGRPTATVSVDGTAHRIDVHVAVTKAAPLVFVREGQENPLDNEPGEINGDGVQLYVVAGADEGAWTIVPVEGASHARARRVRGWDGLALDGASWKESEGGYEVAASVAVPSLPPDGVLQLGLIVNETAPGRARRRGQLVLGGAGGEWTYLRGDRHDRDRLLPIRIG